jgi:hypothetical protein
MNRLLVCSPLRLEARAVRRGIGAGGDVRQTGYGPEKSAAQAAWLRESPFGMLAIAGTGGGLTGDLVSMHKLTRDLRHRYKGETVRRYVADLKRFRLIVQEGRGPPATIQLTAPAIRALVYTVVTGSLSSATLTRSCRNFSGRPKLPQTPAPG